MIKRVEDLLLNFNGKLRQLPFLTFAPNKKILRFGVFLFFVISALTLPLHYAYGIPLADFIANAIFIVFFSVILHIGGYFVRIAIEILNFVLSDQFFRYSLTGLDNPIVNVGWTLVRDLINITFVVILIVIGLATALRYKDYQAKKALPRLIIVALLINFSYIIVGLFVDLTNIVTNFFLTKVDGLNNVGAMVTSQSALIGETLKRGSIIIGLIPAIIQVLLIVFFDILAGITILLFAGLFAIRMIIFMILVILSPAAFAAAILPGTQTYFNQWRQTLTQWGVLGIFAAFFLYLGNHMLIEAPTMIFAAPQTTDYAVSQFVVLLLPYGISIIFLWLGLFMGFAGAPAAANTVIGFAQKGARAPGAWAKSRAGKAATRGIVGPAAGKTSGLIGAAARGAERLDKSLGKYKVPLLATKPLKWTTRGLETAAVPSLIEYAAQQRRISKPKGWDQMSIPEKERYIQGLGSRSDQLVLASDMKGEGTFQKSSSDFRESILKAADKFKTDPRYKKEVGDILDALPDKVTKKMKIDFDLSTFSPTEINPATGRKVIDEERDKIQDKINAIMTEFNLSDENEAAQILHARGLKPKDISEVAKSSLKSDIFRLATRKMSSAHLQALQNNFDEETVHAVLGEEIGVGKGLNALSDAEVAAMNTATGNQKLFRWAHTTPAGREMLNWSERPIPGGATPPGGAPPGGAPPAPTPTLVPPRPPGRTGASRYPQQRIQRLGRQGQRGGSGRPPGRP